MLFNAQMVRALLNDSKTQTRRAVKPQPATGQGMVNASYCGHPNIWLRDGNCNDADPAKEWRCPHGQPGDRLWVRETFVQGYPYDATTDRLLHCDAGGNDLPMKTWYRADKSDIGWSDDDGFQTTVPWKPSIHMPRTASRILLEIVSVRIERLHDISEEDAKAEGAWGPDDSIVGKVAKHFGCDVLAVHPSLAYRMLWESIEGVGSWDLNPLVWVIEFKRVTET